MYCSFIGTCITFKSAETNVQFGSLKMITSHFNIYCFIVILAIVILLILISIVTIAYNIIEDLDSLLMTEPQYRSCYILCYCHYLLEKLLQFALKDYYIFALNILLHFASMLLHFAGILITFCSVTAGEYLLSNLTPRSLCLHLYSDPLGDTNHQKCLS